MLLLERSEQEADAFLVALAAQVAVGVENARRSDRLDLAGEDRADDDEFNRILWRAVKGNDIPYPGVRRSGVLEWARAR